MAARAAAAAMPCLLMLPFLLLAAASGAAYAASTPPISRKSFPEGFIFGTASSAYQVEVHSYSFAHACKSFPSFPFPS